MKFQLKSLILLLFLFSNSLNAQLLNYGGNDFFLNGTNIAWNNYGWDFGDNAAGYGGGNGYDATWWNTTFTAIENSGGNSVRIWVHCKGEHNPIFDANAKCTGLNNNFYANLDDMMNLAETHNLMVILCLYDFHLVDVGKQAIIKDTSKTNAYIKNALIPMVQHYNNQCNLIAWEIINEPEWIMQSIPGGGSHGIAAISINQMQRFVGMCASAIHKNSSKYVTVGSASLKWNSTISPCVGNYWSNASLKTAAYNDPKAYLDFYQIHYYDWMASGFSPYGNSKNHWALDKPVLIGETGNEGVYNYQQQYDNSYSNGYAGCLPWAYKSGGAAVWSDFNTEMNSFKTNNSTVVNFSCTILPIHNEIAKPSPFSTATFVEKGNTITIQIDNGLKAKTIRLLDTKGIEHCTVDATNKNEVFITKILTSGIYTLILETETDFFNKKIIVE